MLQSERLAVAAHLHVLLRRKTGRVTDTEWMAANAEYAAEIVRFARIRAVSDNAPELADWAAKLVEAMDLAEPAVPAPSAAAAVAPAPVPPASPSRGGERYVGRLR